MPVQIYPLQRTAPWTRSMTKQTHTLRFRTTAGARSTISPKLCMVKEDAEAIIKLPYHFSIQRRVFPTGCTEKFGVNDRRAVSQP